MYQVIIVIHILLGLSIIGLILMQQGKGADAGATFGGGASGSVFGAQGAASFLSRTTAIMATLFFITSLGLAWMNSNRTGAAVDFMGTAAPVVEKEAPDLGLPNVDGANVKESIPAAPLPENNKSVTVPPPVATPPVSTTPPVELAPNPATEKTEAPKAAESAVVEEQESELKTEEPAKKSTKKK
jgi:preprotein translocase subunit SecG